jgi:dTDP-4-amino-4,6-dideoxygalactose transaminase
MLPFNKPFLTGKETEYIKEAVLSGKISGDGVFTKRCHALFEARYSFKKVLLTTSCTHALEMAAILIGIKPGDEVIIPSYTFVSTANAFVLRGARVVFADSNLFNPNIDAALLEGLITEKTKAIVPVHYAGIACDMDKIMELAAKYHLWVVEDAAQAIDSYHTGKDGVKRPLGSIGHLGAFSFHETKNIIAGEGGMLAINDIQFVERAEIIREKGTNRSSFFRGEVDKYGWVDIGSSYLPSEVIAAFLFAQLENIDLIQQKRRLLWARYVSNLRLLPSKFDIQLPFVSDFATNNAHMFYIVCVSLRERSELIDYLKKNNIFSVFHYLSLHSSPYFNRQHDKRDLPQSDRYSDCLLRLPMYYGLSVEEVDMICDATRNFFEKSNADSTSARKQLKLS